MVRAGLVACLLTALLAVCGACESPEATVTPAQPEAAATANRVSETPSRTATSTAVPPEPSQLATAQATGSPTPTTEPSPTATAEATPAPTAFPTPTADLSPTATATPEQRPTPTVTETPPTPFIGFTDLPLGEPRYQPSGYALFSRLLSCVWACDGGSLGVLRTVFSEQDGELVIEDLLAPLDETGYVVDFEMSESGRLMAASLCVVGYCGGVDGPSDDAEQEIRVSRDGGKTWVSWGAVDPLSWMVKATDDDVAVLEQIDATSTDQVRWIRSGKVFPAPSAGSSSWPSDWQGETPVWGGWELPPAPPALSELTDWTWIQVQTVHDGSTVWSAQRYGEPLLLLAVVNGEGAVRDVYGWRNADEVWGLVGMGDGLFAGFSIQGAHDGLATAYLPFLIDLTTATVHPLLGLPSGGPWPTPWRAIPLSME